LAEAGIRAYPGGMTWAGWRLRVGGSDLSGGKVPRQPESPLPFSEREPMRRSCLEERRVPKRVYVKPEVFGRCPRGLNRAMRVRRTIERLFGEVKTWHLMVRARCRGLERGHSGADDPDCVQCQGWLPGGSVPSRSLSRIKLGLWPGKEMLAGRSIPSDEVLRDQSQAVVPRILARRRERREAEKVKGSRFFQRSRTRVGGRRCSATRLVPGA